jgi:hypothetical protein
MPLIRVTALTVRSISHGFLHTQAPLARRGLNKAQDALLQSPFNDILSLSTTISPLYRLSNVCFPFLSDVLSLTRCQPTQRNPRFFANSIAFSLVWWGSGYRCANRLIRLCISCAHGYRSVSHESYQRSSSSHSDPPCHSEQ